MKDYTPSRSSGRLRRILPDVLVLFRDHGIHRTSVYKYARGEVIPKADRAALMEKLTGGFVPAGGWAPPAVGKSRSPR